MESISDMLEEGRSSRVERFYGKYRATVTDNNDPLSLGRVRASVPEVLGDVNTGWALPVAPYAGDGSGFYMVPPVGAGVWIEFEAGDVSRPLWVGCWWSDGQLPKDEAGSGTNPDKKIIRTEQGLMLVFDDSAQTLTLSDANGNNLLKFEMQQGQVKLQVTTKVIVEAPQIELVQNATHPLVFGDNLLTYLNQLVSMFNSHVHPGELALGVFPITPAPPVPPFPPATPSLLSMRVKCG